MKTIINMARALILAVAAATFVQSATLYGQPVMWEDLADLDVFRVNDTFYYSASTMHYSPGAPILESKDLINWEYIGHSVPVLNWGVDYFLQDNSSAYVKGVYASSLRRRPTDGQWFWVGCIEYSRTYIYTAPEATGPWTQLIEMADQCYYDCGLLFDDDGTPYVAYGSTTIHVAQLSDSLTTQVKDEAVYTYDIDVEGSRMYKINGTYYILNDAPSTFVEYVMKASSPFGPYTSAILSNAPASPIASGGVPHQGGIVDDVDGNWYYMAFTDSYPGGRVPVLGPIEFTPAGFPQLPNTNSWPTEVTTPMATTVLQYENYEDLFTGTSLSPQWEWNHNPNPAYYSVNNGLTLRTVNVTNNLYMAQNTLTHRILGPESVATIKLDYSNMHAGDRAGLVMLRDQSAWVGAIDNGNSKVVAVWTGLSLLSESSGWVTSSVGYLETSASVPSTGTIYLQAQADIRPSTGGTSAVKFSYSLDGNEFTQIGSAFTMNATWEFFMGYRYGIFNFATEATGGSVEVGSFSMQYPSS